MTRRLPAYATALLLLLPVSGSPGLALPELDREVGPDELMNEIGRLVRREFFDPRALGAFNAAEGRFKELAAAGPVAEASSRWLETLQASHTGRFTPEQID